MIPEKLKNYMFNENDFFNEDYVCVDPEKEKLVKELANLITDDIKIRKPEQVDVHDPDFWILDRLLTKEQVKFMLTFEKKRVVKLLPEQMAERNNMTAEEAEKMAMEICEIGLMEFDRENPEHRRQYFIPKWVVGSGKVFTIIPKITEQDLKDKYTIREIGIGCDYGSVNATTFCGIALALNNELSRWELVFIDTYYHDPKTEGDTPTTEYYSNQLREFITYLQKKYVGVPVNTLVIDSEAAHFDNRLTVDGIRHELAKKNNITVDKSVQLMQSLMYKEILRTIEMPTIRYFQGDTPIYAGHDVAYEELESYHYDEIKSEREGSNCYVKEFDHSVDGRRYIIMEFELTGRCPVV